MILNLKKWANLGGIPQNFLEYSGNILDSYLTGILNCDLANSTLIKKELPDVLSERRCSLRFRKIH